MFSAYARHRMVMHQAASEILTSCIPVKFGVAISDDMHLVHNSKFLLVILAIGSRVVALLTD